MSLSDDLRRAAAARRQALYRQRHPEWRKYATAKMQEHRARKKEKPIAESIQEIYKLAYGPSWESKYQRAMENYLSTEK
jgi:hypothetical protein